MDWLISEVFGPAKTIGDTLAAAYNDNEVPVGVYKTVQVGDTIAPATKGRVFFAHCFKPLARMQEGLKRADQDFANLPPDVAAEIRNLQRIVNGAVGTISVYEGAMYYAGSDIGSTGSRGWSAVIRHIKGIPFPSAEDVRTTGDTMTKPTEDETAGATHSGDLEATKGEIMGNLPELIAQFQSAARFYYDLAFRNGRNLPDLQNEADTFAAMNRIVQVGKPLAVELERAGEDPTELHQLLDAAFMGLEKDRYLPAWELVRVSLARIDATCAAMPKPPDQATGNAESTAEIPTRKGEVLSEQLRAYQRQQIMRYLGELRTQETAKTADYLESIKSHPGYQALTQDRVFVRITAEWQTAIEQDKQDRAFVQGRFREDLSEDEKTKVEKLDAILHERLFPLRQAIVELRDGYEIPLAPEATESDETKREILQDEIDRRIPQSFVEIADTARLLYTFYPDGAKEYRRAKSSLEFCRDVEWRANPELPTNYFPAKGTILYDALHDYNHQYDHCRQMAMTVGNLGLAVATRLPALWPSLRLVGMGVRWHEDEEFNWEAAIVELRQIEAVALSATLATPTPNKVNIAADPNRSKEKGENMDSLAADRIRRIHGWFLDAAEKYADLRFAAVTTDLDEEGRPERERWPNVNTEHGITCGLTPAYWRAALNKPVGTLFAPFATVWLRIEDKLWQGGFFPGTRLRNQEGHELKSQYESLLNAVTEFERLAVQAVAEFEIPSSPLPFLENVSPYGSKPSDRWLEIVAGMPFVSVEKRSWLNVREIPGHLFTASAKAIDVLRQTTVTPKQNGVSGDSDTGQPVPTKGHIADRASPKLHAACYEFLTYLENLPPEHQIGVCAEDMPPGVWNEDAATLCMHHDLVRVCTSPPESKHLRPVGTRLFAVNMNGAACLAERRLREKPPAKRDEGEGNGGAGTGSKQPAAVSGIVELEPADRKAYYTYSYVEYKIGKKTDRAAYDWLQDSGLPDESESPDLAKELTGYTLPAFDTWSRQLRSARKALGEQKHSRRSCRATGSSIVQRDEIEHQKSDEE